MLGLGLGSHKASALRSLAAKLLAKLRGRSTYYENNQASKDTIHEIDNYELLDKATILLTPTATSDARVHSVKTYTGENILIGNNSTFDSDVGDWVSYGAGTPSHSTDKLEVSVTASEGGAMIPTNSLFTGGQSGKTLKVRAKLWLGTMTNTAFKAYIGGVQENVTISSTPTYYEFYLKPTGSGNLIIYKTTISGSEGTFFIDDVSIIDVSSDFDFDRASSATRINSSGLVQDMQSITDPELVTDGDFALTGTQAASTTGAYWTTADSWTISNNKASYDGTTNGSILEQAIDLDNGNTYEVTLTISDNSGRFRLSIDSGTADYNTYTTGNGTYKFYFVASADEVQIRGSLSDSATTFSLSDISVKDVTFSTDVDLARINYDSNGENGHILLEPTSTNLVPYSEDFSKWTAGGNTVIYPNYTAPDGTSSAYKVSGSSGALTYYASATSTQTRTIWAKTVSGTGQAHLCSYFGNTNNLKTITNEWQRFEVNGTTASTGETTFYAIDFRGSTDLTEIILWGAQLEALPYATSYIPNHGTAAGVTRAAETLTGSGNSTLINSTEGVLYAEIAMLSENDKDSDNQLFLNDGTSLQRVGIFTESAGDIRVQIRDNDEAIDIRNLTALDQSESGIDTAAFNKIAIQYKSGENKLFVNGSRITDTNFDSMVFNFSSLDNLDFGSGANSNYFRGKCKALAVFNEALSDDELELLTGVTNYGSFSELASANGYTII